MTQTHSRPAGNGAAAEQVGETSSQSTHATDTLRPLAGWCPPGGCPVRVAGQIQRAAVMAHAIGRAYERAELAELAMTTWAPIARRTREQWVAARIAEMEAAAQRVATDLLDRYGRVPWTYTGGPVDWNTGRPVSDGDWLPLVDGLYHCSCRRLPDGRHRVPDDAPIGAAA
ncbi:hypothetical protein [Micromonospora sp. NPDC005413]|uniref:hypothetical protein n=1 Tax=Micromonospora sp. NPDC005413 TaxID=3154563 RepID=UPI00339DA9FC